MRLLIDPAAVARFAYRTETAEYGDLRRYYCAAAPHRAILVCRHGLELAELGNTVVDAGIGREAAWREFCRPGLTGQDHTKVTIYRVLRQQHYERSLSQVLHGAPRDTQED